MLGGARSGKSAFAEQLAATLGEPVLYVATATASDEEMADRIRRHREQRPKHWRTLEEPHEVARALDTHLDGARTVLVEDLTLLLSNVLGHQGPAEPADELDFMEVKAAEHAVGREVEALFELPAHVVLVSNEVGMGLVPAYRLGRLFRDALGRVNQVAAARADEVYLLVAGLPMRLKPRGAPLEESPRPA